MKSKSSPSKKTAPPVAKEREAHDPGKMRLQIVEPSPTSLKLGSPITLPRGWVVEQSPRPNYVAHLDRVDKNFRSLTAVQKYLSEEMESTLTTQRVKPSNENSMQIVPHVFTSSTSFKLSPGWTVEEKPHSNVRYAGVVDRFYFEPGTGRRFRLWMNLWFQNVYRKHGPSHSYYPSRTSVDECIFEGENKQWERILVSGCKAGS